MEPCKGLTRKAYYGYMPGFSFIRSSLSGSKLVATLLCLAALSFAATASASVDRWDYIVMCDHDASTGQEVGYLMLHVDLPITTAGAAVASAAAPATSSVTAKSASTSVAAKSATAVQSTISAEVQTRAEQAVLSSLSGEGDFDHAVKIVAAQAEAAKQHLPGLAEFLLARQTGDTEGFKQWTLTSKALQVRAAADAATGATVVTYKRMVAELRVQIKLGPDYRTVIAGLESARSSNFNAAVDKVILATNKASNGGIDYGTYVVDVLKTLKSTRKQPVPFTQRTMQTGVTNSAQ